MEAIDVRFMNKLDTMEQSEKTACYNYFTKRDAVKRVLDVLREKKVLKRSPFGNANGKVLFVVDFDKTNDPCIEIIKKYYEINNLDIYSSYFTQFNKTDSAKLNFGVLKKELEIIKPQRVIFITDIEMPNIEGSVSIPRRELEEILKYGKIKDSATDEQKIAVARYKKKLHKVMEFAILGR